ncbi:MAG: M14 family metallopeptidase [bacterium]
MRPALIAPFVAMLLLFRSALAGEFEFYPATSYDLQIPTLKQVVGHDWGEKITSHSEMLAYVAALTASSPKIEKIEYGETWEGRKLLYLIVASEDNLGRLSEIKAGLQKLADPRTTTRAEAESLIASLPSVVWLAYAVHGNEISGTDAALLTSYHLVAAETDSVARSVLDHTIVILDPLQNPDGRDRFVSYFRQNRSRWPDPAQQAAEHNEDWPGGRTNHYLFDMNRDWFALTQPETRGRVQAYLEWYPQVFVDLHEMGANSSYYFPPPADPLNPEITQSQSTWLARFGKNTARWFDHMRFDYFTREIFDSFYPGYGEAWPMYHGSIGMTYEQASTRGLVVKRRDETTLTYQQAVQHHFIASLATAEMAARERHALLRYFYDARSSAITEGQNEPVKAYILPPGRDANRVKRLVSLLLRQGIEVKKSNAAFRAARVRDYDLGKVQSKSFPAGTYVVSLAQPAKRLLNTLMAKQTEIDTKFIQEQLRRYKKRMPDQIYDLTGWSLPLLFDVKAFRSESRVTGDFSRVTEGVASKGRIIGGRAGLAYLIPWHGNSAAKALARCFREEIKVYSADKPFAINGVKFPSGSLIIKVKNNSDELHQRLAKIAEETGVEITATHSAWVSEGVNFGSNEVKYLERPKVALAYNIPTHPYSVGWTRYLLERGYDYPVTIINTMQLPRLDLTDYNVLILPNSAQRYGSYKKLLGQAGARKLETWVENGGTLITFGEATLWLTDEKVGLLATTREFKGGKPEKKKKKDPSGKAPAGEPKQKSGEFNIETAILPEEELPAATPGAILRVVLDTEHWLAFGYDGDANALVSSRNIFTPLKLNKGRNVGTYADKGKVVVSGFTWPEEQKQIASKAYLMHQPHGRGHVVAFAEDPNVRAFIDGLNLLFMNAVFLGPAH